MKVYIAGPMRGIAGWNFAAFDDAALRWREAGHTVFSPAEMCRGLGLASCVDSDASPDTPAGKDHLIHVMMSDIVAISRCDALALLDGWCVSTGATFEVAVAQFLGLSLFRAETFEDMTAKIPPRPWAMTALLSMAAGAELAVIPRSAPPERECFGCGARGPLFAAVHRRAGDVFMCDKCYVVADDDCQLGGPSRSVLDPRD